MYRENWISITLIADGDNRYRIESPFHFTDGDFIVILLKNENGTWIFSDECHTYMHLADSLQDCRIEDARKILSNFDIEDRGGELISKVVDNQFGEALKNYTDAIKAIIIASGRFSCD